MKKQSYTKAALVRELSFNTGMTQKKIREILDTLTAIVYREATDRGITIPGICRIDTVERKARQVRNPRTGDAMIIGKHVAVRARIIKKAREIVPPPDKKMLSEMDGDEKVRVFDDFSRAVSFCCKQCGQEIEAPHSAAGLSAECPACKSVVTVPSVSEPGTMHGTPLAGVGVESPAGESSSGLEEKPQIIQEIPRKTTQSSPEVIEADAGTHFISAPSIPAPETPPLPGVGDAATDPGRKAQTIRIDLSALGFDGDDGSTAPSKRSKPRMLSFFCRNENCRQEIEAHADMAGVISECPACGAGFEVPFFSDPGTLHGSDLEPKKMDKQELQNMKNRTIRIEIPDDF